MKIAVTGCNGNVGKRCTLLALKEGHEVVGIDFSDPPEHEDIELANAHEHYKYLKVDLRDHDATMEALRGSDAIIQLAAFPNPTDYLWKTHNRFATCFLILLLRTSLVLLHFARSRYARHSHFYRT